MPAKIQCANCSRAADKKCLNCEKPQCSFECHASSCKDLNGNGDIDASKSVYLNQLPSKISARILNQVVKMTSVINHRMVFIRPADVHDDIKFARLLCDTVKYAKDAAFLTMLPPIGSLVLAKFDYYQRALVLKQINDTDVAVAFIDFGNIETRAFNQLKVMSDDLKKKNRFATKIELNHIDHDIINDEALKVLYHYMAQDTELKLELGEFNNETKTITGSLRAPDKWINQLVNKMNTKDVMKRTISDVTDRVS